MLLPRTAAILSPSRLQWGIRCDPCATLACFAHGEQQTNEPESQTPTQKSLPAVLARCSPLKGHLEIGVENETVTRLCLYGAARIHLSPSCPTEALALSPWGKRYNEVLYAYTPPHFNCKRCTHPALWASDGCIMGRAPNMTVHHVRAVCRFTFHCCLLQLILKRLVFPASVLQCWNCRHDFNGYGAHVMSLTNQPSLLWEHIVRTKYQGMEVLQFCTICPKFKMDNIQPIMCPPCINTIVFPEMWSSLLRVFHYLKSCWCCAVGV